MTCPSIYDAAVRTLGVVVLTAFAITLHSRSVDGQVTQTTSQVCAVRLPSWAPPSDSVRSRTLRDSANRSYSDGSREMDPRTAVEHFRRARDQYAAAGLLDGLSAALGAMAREFERLSMQDSAIATRDIACTSDLALERYVGLVHDVASLSLLLLNAHDSRADHSTRLGLQLAEGLGEPSTLRDALLLRGALLDSDGAPDSARAMLKRASVAAARASRPADPMVIGEARGLLLGAALADGPALSDAGRRDMRASFVRAMTLFHSQGDSIGEGTAAAGLATDYARYAQYDSSLEWFGHALRLYREGGASGTQLAGVELNLGLVLTHNGAPPDSTRSYLEASARHAEGIVGRGTRAAALLALGRFLREQRDTTGATQAFRTAHAIQESRDPRALNAGDWEVLGETQLFLGLHDSARSALRRSASLASLTSAWRAYALLAQSYLDSPRPDSARGVALLDSAISALSSRAAAARTPTERVQFIDQFALLARTRALAWLARAGRDLDVESATMASWAVADYARGRSLLFSLDALRAWMGGADSDAGWIERGRRAYSWLDLAGAAPDAMLSYLVTPTRTAVWLLLPDGRALSALVEVGRDSLARLEALLRRSLGADSAAARLVADPDSLPFAHEVPADPATERRASQALSRILLPTKLQKALPDSGLLLIHPDGPIGRVPFAMLPVGNRLVIDRFAVHMAPSHEVLEQLTLEDGRRGVARSEQIGYAVLARRKPPTAFVVGNPTMPTLRTRRGTQYTLSPLPSAFEEADSIAKLLGVRALTKDQPTIAAVTAGMPEAGVIHLATHAVARGSWREFLDSYLALAPGPGSEADGILTIRMLMSDSFPRLRAELVSLSACQTALGALSDSEGVLSLAWGFLGKGAVSVIATQWSVNTFASAAVMESFYTNWLGPGSPSKAVALRQAQLAVRRMPGFSNPRHWAGFALIGAR